MKPRAFAFAFVLALAAPVFPLAPPALAIGAGEALGDPAQEARARELFKDLRCLVCQNQSIDDSDADLAYDLRVLVRERIAAGDSDKQVIGFLTARYGDFVLLKPPVKASTLPLWIAPFAILLAGAGALALIAMRRRGAATRMTTAPLSAAEKARLDALLKPGPDGDARP